MQQHWQDFIVNIGFKWKTKGPAVSVFLEMTNKNLFHSVIEDCCCETQLQVLISWVALYSLVCSFVVVTMVTPSNAMASNAMQFNVVQKFDSASVVREHSPTNQQIKIKNVSLPRRVSALSLHKFLFFSPNYSHPYHNLAQISNSNPTRSYFPLKFWELCIKEEFSSSNICLFAGEGDNHDHLIILLKKN